MRVLTLGVIVALSVVPARAEHCEAWTTSEPRLFCGDICLGEALDLADHYAFVEGGDCPSGCIYSVWVYEETNGFAGLQRGDEMVDDTCHEMIPADRIVL